MLEKRFGKSVLEKPILEKGNWFWENQVWENSLGKPIFAKIKFGKIDFGKSSVWEKPMLGKIGLGNAVLGELGLAKKRFWKIALFDRIHLRNHFSDLPDGHVDRLHRHKIKKKIVFDVHMFEDFAYKPIADSLETCFDSCKQLIFFRIDLIGSSYDRSDALLWPFDLSYSISYR